MAETLETIKKYIGPFSGAQMDQIFYEILNYTSERYAKGTANGQAVAAGTIGYNDNSYYYSRQALQSAQAAENAAARAESAVPAGIDSAVLFTRAQTLTAAQKSQARANIMAGGSNPNLLDNPWFTVNQRGWTSGIASNAYCVDRWKAPFANQALKITVNSDNTITIDRLTSGTTGFYQYLDIKNLDRTKRYTLSVMDSDGNIYSHTVPFPTGQSGERWFTIGTLSVAIGLWAIGGNQNNIAFVLYMSSNANPQTATIKACKMEEGEYSTLANDASPNYAEELAKCQRYFTRLKPITTNGFAGIAIAAGATQARAMLPLPTTMRDYAFSSDAPFSGVVLRNYDLSQTINVSAVTFGTVSTGMALLVITASGLTAGQTYFVGIPSGAYIDIPADL